MTEPPEDATRITPAVNGSGPSDPRWSARASVPAAGGGGPARSRFDDEEDEWYEREPRPPRSGVGWGLIAGMVALTLIILVALGAAAYLAVSSRDKSSGDPEAKSSTRPSATRTTARRTAGPTRGGAKVPVPQVRGKSESVAKEEVSQAGLEPDIVLVPDQSVSDGTVLEVEPEPGTQITQGSQVTLRIAVTMVAVPRVVGLTAEQAQGELSTRGFTPAGRPEPNANPELAGRVFAQDPGEGVELRYKSKVTYRYYADPG